MTDHADTIRRYIIRSAPPPPVDWPHAGADANDALSALLAKRQQAIDALRRIRDETPHYEPTDHICPACIAEVALAAVRLEEQE